ncbi:MAG TPA: DUF6510 family protein [Arachnia sp.]|nr:DUF6510 family protein [Arachnia sp.]HQD21691.1 DUF6510 family protein [Arachnia sp.]
MLADPVDQRRLLTLADLDSEMARVQHTARTLPQHAAIAELMANRQTAGDELVASDTEVEDLGAAVRKAEADLLPVRSRLERERQRIADGSVVDAKILRSLTEEVEHVQRRITELEDAELELMGQLEEATERRDKVAAAKEQIDVKLRAEVAARDEAVAALRQEGADLAATRGPIASLIPKDLGALYEKLRANTGLGAAMLRAGRCGGCQLEATIADLDAYRRAPANQVLRCVECDRILVRTPESGL